jgi:hypothetical protein
MSEISPSRGLMAEFEWAPNCRTARLGRLRLSGSAVERPGTILRKMGRSSARQPG